jgi:hypothetical protein
VQSTQVLDSKITTQCRHETTSSSIRGANEDDIININQQIHRDIWMLKKEQGHVSSGWNKPKSSKNRAKTCMPHTRSLLQSIQSLYKAAETLRTCRINKAWGLTHINLLLQNTMQKSILHIKLTKEPSLSNSQGEQ